MSSRYLLKICFLYIECLSRDLDYEMSRSILSIPSCTQSIRLVTMSSNSLQAFHERSYAPRISPRSVVTKGNLWYLHSWSSGFAACCSLPVARCILPHLFVSSWWLALSMFPLRCRPNGLF
jgi:hypothetical protein